MSLLNLFKFERCEDWLFNCPFSTQPDNCVNKFCNGNGYAAYFGSCAKDFPTPGACCSKSNPATCLATYQANLNDSDGSGACAKVRSALINCDVILPGFATREPQDQASCLCYSSGTYNPSSWDNAATSCYASGSSAHPVLYSILTAQSNEALGFCTNYAGPAANSAATTTVVDTETESGSLVIVTRTRTRLHGVYIDSTETVTTTVSSGAGSTAATTTGLTVATPGTAASNSLLSSTAKVTSATPSIATTSGAEKPHIGMKLKLGVVGLLLPSVLMFAFA